MLTDLLNEETTQAMFMCVCRGWFFLVTPRKFSSPSFSSRSQTRLASDCRNNSAYPLVVIFNKLTKG